MNKVEKLGVLVFILFLFSLLGYFIFLDVTVKEHYKTDKVSIIIHKWDVVDSVDVIRPGEINTLQFDYMYKVYTNGKHEFVTRQKFKKGDSIHYIYRK